MITYQFFSICISNIRLLHNKKLVILNGIEGMGKTSLLKNLCNYIKHRGKFENGIVFIDCKQICSQNELLKNIEISFNQLWGNTSSNSNQNEGEIIGQLCNTLAKNHILLIFDNVNKVLETDETGFSSIIEKLHSVCDQSRILISSDKEISHLKSIDKAVFELIHLPLQQGIKLLIDKCTRKIDNKEIAELIKSEANCKNLLEHPFAKYLGGYPKKIVEAAEALKTQTLVEYYNQIKLN